MVKQNYINLYSLRNYQVPALCNINLWHDNSTGWRSNLLLTVAVAVPLMIYCIKVTLQILHANISKDSCQVKPDSWFINCKIFLSKYQTTKRKIIT